ERKSDPKDGRLRGKRIRWRVRGESRPPGEKTFLRRGKQKINLRQGNPVDFQIGRLCRNERSLSMTHCATAILLQHRAAFAMHSSAANSFWMAHRLAGDTGHHGRRRNQQEQNSNDSGQTPHDKRSIYPTGFWQWSLNFGY